MALNGPAGSILSLGGSVVLMGGRMRGGGGPSLRMDVVIECDGSIVAGGGAGGAAELYMFECEPYWLGITCPCPLLLLY